MEFSLKQVEWLPTFGWEVQKIDTKVSILLGLQFPLFLSLAKSENGDRFEKENGSRVTLAFIS